jgi:hypothetical protein
VDLYNALIKLRPEWEDGDNVNRTSKFGEEGTSWKTRSTEEGTNLEVRSTVLKVVMTGSAEARP